MPFAEEWKPPAHWVIRQHAAGYRARAHLGVLEAGPYVLVNLVLGKPRLSILRHPPALAL